jgi:integrase
MVIGKYGRLTVEKARKKARKALSQVDDGADPSSERQAARAAPTMEDLAERYLKQHAAPKKKPASVEEDRRMFRNQILPTLGKLKVAGVTRGDISALHARLGSTPYRANRVLALLSKAFNLATVWGWRPEGDNPCRHVDRYPEKRRERYLSLEEIANLGRVLDQAEHERTELPGVITAIRLLLLTGCRLREILTLRWEDVDLEDGCLHLTDSKTGKRTVHISQAAVEVLTQAERLEGNPWVIPGVRKGQHLVNLTKPWYRLRQQAGLDGVRIHDLRHTYASFGAAAGYSLLLIGKMLGHSKAATTERYAHLAADPVRQAAEVVGREISAALNQRLNS